MDAMAQQQTIAISMNSITKILIFVVGFCLILTLLYIVIALFLDKEKKRHKHDDR